MRHQLSLLSTTRSSLTRIISATRSTPCPSFTEATSRPSSTEPTGLKNIVCHRQDMFLVSHGIIPECLLHSNRQMNSIPRLSGQNSDFDGTLLQHIIFVTTDDAITDANFRQLSSESKNSYLYNASCLVEYRNCLISNLSSRSQTKISHIDNSHLVGICFCHAATQKSSPTSLTLVSTRFALIPGSTNR